MAGGDAVSLLTDEELRAAREAGTRSVNVDFSEPGRPRYGTLLPLAQSRAVERAVLARVASGFNVLGGPNDVIEALIEARVKEEKH